MQITTAIPLGPDNTLLMEDVVIRVEWYSGLQDMIISIDGAYDYINGKEVVAPFEPAIEAAIYAKLLKCPEILAELKAEWEESSEGRERFAAA